MTKWLVMAALACGSTASYAASLTVEPSREGHAPLTVDATISRPPIGSAYTGCIWTTGDGVLCNTNDGAASSVGFTECSTTFRYTYLRPGTYTFRVVCTQAKTTALTRVSATITVLRP